MSSSISAVGQQTQTDSTSHDTFKSVDLDDFVKLLIAELSNQDPLNPMDNSQILQQVSQMREIESNTRMTETLEAVKLGQNMATAANLIDRKIVALTDEGKQVSGKVDRVSIQYGVPKLHIGQQVVDLRNVAGVLSDAPSDVPSTDDKTSSETQKERSSKE